MNQLFVIDGVSVRQFNEFHYCLNDLQKAAVVALGEKRSPRTMEVHEFIRRPETQALVELLEKETTGNSRSNPVITVQGRNGGTYVCKELVYAYAMWISATFHLKVIRTFDAVSRPAPPVNNGNSDKMQAGIILIEFMRRTLNLSDSSVLGACHTLEQAVGLPGLSPKYAIDAPSDSLDVSSHATQSLSTLLKVHNVRITAAAAYRQLQLLGIVERLQRPSTSKTAKNGVKEFWSVTVAGGRYGKNITSPGNPRETQPHFFVSQAVELIRLLEARDVA